MSIYTVFIFLIKITQFLLSVTFVFLTYKPTKDFIIKNLNKELSIFHKQYLENNYHLKLKNLNKFDEINEAMLHIKSQRIFFDRIPDDKIIFNNMLLKFLNKYNKYPKKVLFLIGLTISIELGISIGLNI